MNIIEEGYLKVKDRQSGESIRRKKKQGEEPWKDGEAEGEKNEKIK